MKEKKLIKKEMTQVKGGFAPVAEVADKGMGLGSGSYSLVQCRNGRPPNYSLVRCNKGSRGLKGEL